MPDPFEGKDIKFKLGDKEVDPSAIRKPHHAVVSQPRASADADTTRSDNSEKTESGKSETVKLKEPHEIPEAEHIVSPDWLGRPHFAMPDLRRPGEFNTNSSGLLFGGDHRPTKP